MQSGFVTMDSDFKITGERRWTLRPFFLLHVWTRFGGAMLSHLLSRGTTNRLAKMHFRLGKRTKVALCIALLMASAAALLWLEPFAKRYEGKTLNQWLDASIKENGIRRDAVIAFGEEAVPALLAASDRWRWLWSLSAKVSDNLAEKMSSGFQITESARQVHDWLAVLHDEGYSVLNMLAEAQQGYMIFHVLSFADVREVRATPVGTTTIYLIRKPGNEC